MLALVDRPAGRCSPGSATASRRAGFRSLRRAADERRVAFGARSSTAVLRRPLISVARRRRRPGRAGRPGAQPAHRAAGQRHDPAEPAVGQDLRRLQTAFPGTADHRRTSLVKADDVQHGRAVRGRSPTLSAQAIATGQFDDADHVDYKPDGTVALSRSRSRAPAPTQAVDRGTARRCEDDRPATVGELDGADVGVTGPTAKSKDFNDQMKHAAPLGLRVRAAARVRAACWSRSGRSSSRSRRSLLNLLSVGAAYGVLRARLPGRLGRGAARLHAERRHRRGCRSSCS